MLDQFIKLTFLPLKGPTGTKEDKLTGKPGDQGKPPPGTLHVLSWYRCRQFKLQIATEIPTSTLGGIGI